MADSNPVARVLDVKAKDKKSRDTAVEVVNERCVVAMGFRRNAEHSVHAFMESFKYRPPIEIQTNGGTMAIKG